MAEKEIKEKIDRIIELEKEADADIVDIITAIQCLGKAYRVVDRRGIKSGYLSLHYYPDDIEPYKFFWKENIKEELLDFDEVNNTIFKREKEAKEFLRLLSSVN